MGTGLLTLLGGKSGQANTIVAGGTLQIGNGGSSTRSAAPSGVLNNGSLVFNHADAVNFSSPISGSGSVTQTGSGTLTLTGTTAARQHDRQRRRGGGHRPDLYGQQPGKRGKPHDQRRQHARVTSGGQMYANLDANDWGAITVNAGGSLVLNSWAWGDSRHALFECRNFVVNGGTISTVGGSNGTSDNGGGRASPSGPRRTHRFGHCRPDLVDRQVQLRRHLPDSQQRRALDVHRSRQRSFRQGYSRLGRLGEIGHGNVDALGPQQLHGRHERQRRRAGDHGGSMSSSGPLTVAAGTVDQQRKQHLRQSAFGRMDHSRRRCRDGQCPDLASRRDAGQRNDERKRLRELRHIPPRAVRHTTLTANGANNAISAGNFGMAGNLVVDTPLPADALAIAAAMGDPRHRRETSRRPAAARCCSPAATPTPARRRSTRARSSSTARSPAR